MIKHVIKIILVFYSVQIISFSQDIRSTAPGNESRDNVLSQKYLLQQDLTNEKDVNKENSDEKVHTAELYRYSFDIMQKSKTMKEESRFNIVSSFRQNIRFGGFWDRYAIVNFTPDMFIQPLDFISIYAVHNSSYFVPIKAVKEHFKLMALQGAAIMIIDNSVKHLLPAGKMIKSIIGFALKNAVLNTLLKNIINNGNDRVFEQGSYYCAVSIRF